MQEILDDDDIKNKLLAPLEKELGGLQFWLFFSGILLLIAGALGSLAMLSIINGPRFYYWLEILFVFGIFIAFITALPMAYTHFKSIKNSKTFCEEETEENFKKLLITSAKDWRLLAFAFVFCTIAITPLITYETYRDWNRESYTYTTETPTQVTEPEPDGRLENPEPIENNLPSEEVLLEEDPGPE